MDRETEFALVRRMALGDTAAYDAIYDEYRGRLYSFLIRLSRRRDLAEDFLEETWLRLVSHAGRFSRDTPLAPWLYTVARNLYFSYCRSRAVEDERWAGLMGLWPGAAREPSPFEEASAGELEARLEQALAALPARYRELLQLSLVEEMTPAELARVCGVTPRPCAGVFAARERCWPVNSSNPNGVRIPPAAGGDPMMRTDSGHDDESRMLASLPAYEPERQCSERIRGRCHAALRLQAKRTDAKRAPGTRWRQAFEYAAVGAVCAVYLAEVVRRAVAVYGL